MSVRGRLDNVDDAAIDTARIGGYRKGWNDRKMIDSDIIEAMQESGNFRKFIAAVRERTENLGE